MLLAYFPEICAWKPPPINSKPSFKDRLFIKVFGILKSGTLRDARIGNLLAARKRYYDPTLAKYLVTKDLADMTDQSPLFDPTVLKYTIKSLLESTRDSMPHNVNYRFYYIYHLFRNLRLIQLATVEIIDSLKHPHTLENEFQFYRLRKIINIGLKNQSP